MDTFLANIACCQPKFSERCNLCCSSCLSVTMKFLPKKFTRGFLLQFLATLSANLSVICCQMFYGWSSPAIPILRSGEYKFTITSVQASWLVVTPVLSQIIGSLATGPLADHYGRKWIMAGSAFPYMVAWLMVGLAQSVTPMFIGRFIAGVFDGVVYTIIQMYVAEIAHRKVRGFLTAILPVSAIFGDLLVNIIGSYLALDTAAYVCLIVPILLFGTFIWFPESPYYFVLHDRLEEAETSLRFFRDKDDVSKEIGRIADAIAEDGKRRKKFSKLFTKKVHRRCLYLGLLLRAIDQLSGATPILFYTQTIFEESKSTLSASTATILYFCVQLCMTILSAFIVDYFGRKPLLIVSLIGTTLALIATGLYLLVRHYMTSFRIFPILSLLTYVTFSSIGVQTVPFIMLGEIFSTTVKGFAMGLIYTYVGFEMTVTSQFFHWSTDQFGIHVPFFAFAVCCIVLLILVIMYLPETKDKTLEDIQWDMKRRFSAGAPPVPVSDPTNLETQTPAPVSEPSPPHETTVTTEH